MEQFPSSLIDFQRRFSSEEACASWLFAARWLCLSRLFVAGGRGR